MNAVADTVQANAAPATDTRAPWVLAAPALLLFVGVLMIPLAMTVLLSFHDWGQYKGIETVLILKNWHEIATDPYYAEMFWRTFRIALLIDADHGRTRRAGGLYPQPHERRAGRASSCW